MELRRLRYLVTVADERSMTRAAEVLHVSQPGISVQLRALEREVGAELFVRSSRGVTPTAAGEAVLVHARAALASAEAIRDVGDDLAGLRRGRLRIGTVNSGSHGLFGLLAGFHDRHPGIELSLTELGTDDLLAGVREHRMDVALVALTGTTTAGLAARRFRESWLVAVQGDDEAASGDRTRSDPTASDPAVPEPISVSELAGRPLLTLPPGTGVRAALDEACADAGTEVCISCEVASPRAALRLAELGLGTAVVPASEADAAGIGSDCPRRREIAPRIPVALGLVWARDVPSSPALSAFLALAAGPPRDWS